MKKIFLMLICVLLLFSFAGCGESESNSGNNTIPYSYDETEFTTNYPGYFVKYEKGILTVTNHDSDKDTYPEEQEMIQYGECGIHNDGVIYFIYITNEESYCYLEMDPTTQEILHEDDPMFNGSEERNERVNKLIEIINTIIDSKSN